MERTRLRAAILGFALAMGGIRGASAGEDAGWYAGAGVGQSTVDLDQPVENLYVVDYARQGTTDSYQLFGGYRTSPYLAVELAYVRAHGHRSEFTLDCGERPTCQGARYDVREVARLQRLDAAVVATLPIGDRIELVGKIGLTRSRHRLYWSNDGSPFFWRYGDSPTYDDMSTGIVKGGGARFKLSPAWSLRAQYESADEVGGKGNSNAGQGRPASVENWWLGTEYRF